MYGQEDLEHFSVIQFEKEYSAVYDNVQFHSGLTCVLQDQDCYSRTLFIKAVITFFIQVPVPLKYAFGRSFGLDRV